MTMVFVFQDYDSGFGVHSLRKGFLCYQIVRVVSVSSGCDSGFGNDLARRLDADGYHVFAGCLAVDREGARALDAATSSRLRLVPVDVTDDFQVAQAVRVVKENIGENGEWPGSGP